MLTSKVTSASGTVQLVTNTYDSGAIGATRCSAADLPREYDLSHSTSTYTPGNVTQSITPGHTVNSQYDCGGNVVQQDDNYGHSVNVATTINTNFTMPEQISPNGSSQLSTNALYNTPSISPTSVAPPYQSVFDPNTNSNGTAAYTTYDAYGRVQKVYPSQQYSSGMYVYHTYSYGSPWTATASTMRSNFVYNARTQTLDGLGRPVSVTTTASTPQNPAGQPISEVDTAYAPCACSRLGKMSSRTQPYLAPQAPPTTTYQYDALGRTIKITLPDGSITQYLYQGNVTTVTDPAGNWKQYTNDAFGNLVTVLQPDPAHPGTQPPAPATSQYPLSAAPSGLNTLFAATSTMMARFSVFLSALAHSSKPHPLPAWWERPSRSLAQN